MKAGLRRWELRQHEAFSAHRWDDLGIRGIVTQLRAEIGNVHIDGAGGTRTGGKPPDPQENFPAAEGTAGVRGKITQNRDFTFR